MEIAKLQQLVYQIATEHGWHDTPRTFGEDIALIHSEASEALEEYRQGFAATYIYTSAEGKPEGIPIELADIIIRVLHVAAKYNIDMESALDTKIQYNTTRPYRHGGKIL